MNFNDKDFDSAYKYFTSLPIGELKERCRELYDQIEKDEDGFVLFKNDNNENEYLYLKERIFNNVVIREITAVKFDENGNAELWEENREDSFSVGVYDESEYEIFTKLFIMLSNQ